MGFLEDIVEATEAEVARRRRTVPEPELRARFGPDNRGYPFSEALVAPGVSLIAEVKRASPSRGPIRPGASVTEIVRAYEASGAGACSILTEPTRFGGSLDDLVEARAACGLPLLRKDFIVDEYQLLEARAAGADAVLLIVAALEHDRLGQLLQAAADLRLEALVEVHDEEDTQIAVEAGAEIIGVNNRDLRTLEVDPETVLQLLPDIPAGTVVVAESGIGTAEDVRRMGEAGVDAVLVGEALMRAPDPGEAVRALLTGAT
ncbi:MAG TPA: indole-3-glycerol phosphate synthase TrpC [Miltoncostaeaceae bacterium]|nr:indole-3-glycerol phosphate synthase TrpC [Miltoncostaeaceae bacterium]